MASEYVDCYTKIGQHFFGKETFFKPGPGGNVTFGLLEAKIKEREKIIYSLTRSTTNLPFLGTLKNI